MLSSFHIIHRGGLVVWESKPQPSDVCPINALLQYLFIESHVINTQYYEVGVYTNYWYHDKECNIIGVGVCRNSAASGQIRGQLCSLVEKLTKHFVDIYRTELLVLAIEYNPFNYDCFEQEYNCQSREIIKHGHIDVAKSLQFQQKRQKDQTQMLGNESEVSDEAVEDVTEKEKKEKDEEINEKLDEKKEEIEKQIEKNVPAVLESLNRGKQQRREARGLLEDSDDENDSDSEEKLAHVIGSDSVPENFASGSLLSSLSSSMKSAQFSQRKSASRVNPSKSNNVDAATTNTDNNSSEAGSSESLTNESNIPILNNASTAASSVCDTRMFVESKDLTEVVNDRKIFMAKEQKKPGFFSSLFKREKATITDEDFEKIIPSIKDSMKKANVNSDIADEICEVVKERLSGSELKKSSISAIRKIVSEALSNAIVRILHPVNLLNINNDDLLARAREIKLERAKNKARRPMVITFVGVNGVGKSTSLAKVAYMLINAGMRVLICACDTFRAGAVEQLETHVRNLKGIVLDTEESRKIGITKDGVYDNQMIDIYKQSYGSNPSAVARFGIKVAIENNYDAVLVDTTGRMQNNTNLMQALGNLVSDNTPDMVLFVGEALVGNDGTDQLTKFNNVLKSCTCSKGKNLQRGVDGVILTKFDTVGNHVGAALNFCHAVNLPIIFVGIGQHYPDLASLDAQEIADNVLN